MRNEKTILGKILEERKITLEKASELTGLTYGNVIKLTYDTFDFKAIKVDTLLKLCIGLNIKAIDLYPEEDKPMILRLSRKSRKKTF